MDCLRKHKPSPSSGTVSFILHVDFLHGHKHLPIGSERVFSQLGTVRKGTLADGLKRVSLGGRFPTACTGPAGAPLKPQPQGCVRSHHVQARDVGRPIRGLGKVRCADAVSYAHT